MGLRPNRAVLLLVRSSWIESRHRARLGGGGRAVAVDSLAWSTPSSRAGQRSQGGYIAVTVAHENHHLSTPIRLANDLQARTDCGTMAACERKLMAVKTDSERPTTKESEKQRCHRHPHLRCRLVHGTYCLPPGNKVDPATFSEIGSLRRGGASRGTRRRERTRRTPAMRVSQSGGQDGRERHRRKTHHGS